MTAFVTDAVLLGSVAYAEADRIVTLLTRSHGKVSALARSARRSHRRFGASLALFVSAEATLKERPGADLMALERFDARKDFSHLASDVVRLAHASYVTELLRELTVPRQPDAALLDLLLEAYAAIAAQPPRSDTLRTFELRLLEEIGLRPVLDRCVACDVEGAPLDGIGTVVDPRRGGVLCPRCAPAAGPGMRLLPGPARRHLLELRTRQTLAAGLPPAATEVDVAARTAMHALVLDHVHAPMRSLAFIQKLRAG